MAMRPSRDAVPVDPHTPWPPGCEWWNMHNEVAAQNWRGRYLARAAEASGPPTLQPAAFGHMARTAD